MESGASEGGQVQEVLLKVAKSKASREKSALLKLEEIEKLPIMSLAERLDLLAEPEVEAPKLQGGWWLVETEMSAEKLEKLRNRLAASAESAFVSVDWAVYDDRLVALVKLRHVKSMAFMREQLGEGWVVRQRRPRITREMMLSMLRGAVVFAGRLCMPGLRCGFWHANDIIFEELLQRVEALSVEAEVA